MHIASFSRCSASSRSASRVLVTSDSTGPRTCSAGSSAMCLSKRLLRMSRSRTCPSTSAYHFNSLSSSSAGALSKTSSKIRSVLRSRRAATRVLCTAGVPVRIPTSLLASTSHCAATYAATSSPTVPGSIVDACPSGNAEPRARSSLFLVVLGEAPASSSSFRCPLQILPFSGGPQLDFQFAPRMQHRLTIRRARLHLIVGNLQHHLAVGIEEPVRRASGHDRCDGAQALSSQQTLHALGQRGWQCLGLRAAL